MSIQVYKVNQAIDVVYSAVGAKTGITDLTLTPTNPSGVDQTAVTMTEIGNGLYRASFTPDVTGRWKIRITSTSSPENGSAAYYLVGNYSTLEGQLVMIGDIDGNIAGITATKRLLVSQEPPEPPEGTTAVVRTKYDDVAASNDDVYLIPNGETLIIQRFSAGGAEVNGGSVVELWYDPLNTGLEADMTIIDVIFVNGSGGQHDLNERYVGDGTKVVRMRRKRLSGGSAKLFGRWEGYY